MTDREDGDKIGGMAKFPGDKRKRRLRQYRARERKRIDAAVKSGDGSMAYYWYHKSMVRFSRYTYHAMMETMNRSVQRMIVGLTES